MGSLRKDPKHCIKMKFQPYFMLFLTYFGLISVQITSIFGESNIFFQQNSYQRMVVKNGSGTPISETKMSAFSVEDHKNKTGSNDRPPTWRIRTKTNEKGESKLIERNSECECHLIFDQHVCGDDGITYPSSCTAKCHHVKIACERACPCNGTNSFVGTFSDTLAVLREDPLDHGAFMKLMSGALKFPKMPAVPKEDQDWMKKESN